MEAIVNGPSIYFIGILIGIALGIAYLFITLLCKVFPCYRNKTLKSFFWLINIIAVGGIILTRGKLDVFPFQGLLSQITILWFMGQLIGLFMLPFYHGIKRVYLRNLLKENDAIDLSRRKFIQGAAVSLPIISFGLSGYGTFLGGEKVEFLEYDILIKNLDVQNDGLKIGQISDAHIGLFFSVEKLSQILELLYKKGADVVVITGDLIDDVKMIDALIEVLNGYISKFRYGIYFSWGNHEYFRNFPKLETAFQHSEVKVLRNKNTLLINSKKPVYLLGIDYPWSETANEQIVKSKEMLDLALLGVTENSTKILLSHHPVVIDYAYEKNIDLTLTGHTHGGQVAIGRQPLLPVRYKYMRGMYQKEQMYGYVSTGAGSWFPFRLGCPAEISLFTLKVLSDS